MGEPLGVNRKGETLGIVRERSLGALGVPGRVWGYRGSLGVCGGPSPGDGTGRGGSAGLGSDWGLRAQKTQ